jgi:ABC-type phosphate transport system permease subunit
MSVTVQREVRKRGFFGKVFKLLFILFNLAMALWLVSYWVTAGRLLTDAASDAEKAGGAIGATIGTGMLLFFWVAGAVILGLFTLFTRGNRLLITEEKR